MTIFQGFFITEVDTNSYQRPSLLQPQVVHQQQQAKHEDVLPTPPDTTDEHIKLSHQKPVAKRNEAQYNAAATALVKLPPVQNLNMKNIFKNVKYVPATATVVNQSLKQVTHASNDLGPPTKKKPKNAIPLRKEERQQLINKKIHEIAAQLMKNNNFEHSFSKHAPESQSPRSIVSSKSKRSTKSTTSSKAQEPTASQQETAPTEEDTHSLPPISIASSKKSVIEQIVQLVKDQVAQETKEATTTHVDQTEDTKTTHSRQSQALSDLLSSTSSVTRSQISGMSSLSSKKKNESHVSLGSDADADRLNQIEESLRAEQKARRHVQKALKMILKKQEALLSKISEEDRAKLEAIDKQMKEEKAQRKHRRKMEAEAQQQHDAKSVRSEQQVRSDSSASKYDINTLQKLVVDMYTQLQSMSHVSNDIRMQRFVTRIKAKHPELSEVVREQMLSNPSPITVREAQYQRTVPVIDHKGCIVYA